MQIHDVKLEKKHDSGLDDSGSDDIRDGHQGRSSRTPGLSPHDRGRAPSQMSSLQPRSTTPPIIDKRLHQHFVSFKHQKNSGPDNLANYNTKNFIYSLYHYSVRKVDNWLSVTRCMSSLKYFSLDKNLTENSDENPRYIPVTKVFLLHSVHFCALLGDCDDGDGVMLIV